MTNLDLPFFAAALAFGWGLSLATYRIFAVRNDWPMGELHANKPLVPVLLGVFALAIAFLFAAFRAATPATELGGWWILPAGLLWAFFWTGFPSPNLTGGPRLTSSRCQRPAAWRSSAPTPPSSGATHPACALG